MNPKFTLEIQALGYAILVALLSLGGTWLAAHAIRSMSFASSAPAPTEIVATPELIAQGHQLFEMSCSHCHADDATGDEGPNLHRLTLSNARIAATIKKGIKGEMPTFAKKYDDKQIALLVTYLRSLR